MSRLRRIIRETFHAVVPDGLKSRFIQRGRCAVSVVDRWLFNQGEDIPIAIDLETNSDCTRDCDYCPRDRNLDEVLDEGTVHALVDQLAAWGFNGRLSFHSFNEPLTDERLLDFYQYLADHLPQAQSEVFTNGDLLTAPLLLDLLAVGVDRIHVTIHEPTSWAEADRLLALAQHHKQVKIVDFREGTRNHPLENRGGLIDLGEIKPTRFCGRVDAMVVRANGNVVLCCNDALQKQVMGNIHDKPLREIWAEPGYAALRQDIRKGILALDICKACGNECNPGH